MNCINHLPIRRIDDRYKGLPTTFKCIRCNKIFIHIGDAYLESEESEERETKLDLDI